MSIFEKLAKRYNDIVGQSPDESFLSWLAGFGIPDTDEALHELWDNKELWNDLKEEYNNETL
jgi:hypothetical protein